MASSSNTRLTTLFPATKSTPSTSTSSTSSSSSSLVSSSVKMGPSVSSSSPSSSSVLLSPIRSDLSRRESSSSSFVLDDASSLSSSSSVLSASFSFSSSSSSSDDSTTSSVTSSSASIPSATAHTQIHLQAHNTPAHNTPAHGDQAKTHSKNLAIRGRRPRFDALCQALNLDQATMERAWSILELVYWRQLEITTDINEEEEMHWHISAIWIAGREEVKPNGVTLTQLLNKPKMEVGEFFEELQEFLKIYPRDQLVVSADVDLVKNDFSILMVCYMSFKGIFPMLFVPPLEQREGQTLFKFCWNLFLVAKERLLKREDQTVVNAGQLLACCVIYVASKGSFTRSREEIRRKLAEPNDVSSSNGISGNPNPADDLRLLVCQSLRIPEPRKVDDVYGGLFLPFLQRLKASNPKLTFGVSNGSGLSDHLGGSWEHISANAKELGILYEEHIKKYSGECDGRYLGPERESIATPRRTQNSARASHRSPATRSLQREFDLAYQSMSRTPLTARSNGSPLDIRQENKREVQDAIKNSLALATLEPPPSLSEHLRSMSSPDRNMYDEVKHRASAIIDRVKADFPSSSEPNIWDLAHKLYYQTMLAMMMREEKRGSFSTLLGNEVFHYSLLACSMETIRSVFEPPAVRPETIICLFNKVKPFDFLMIIENFIKEQQHLGRPLVKRLKEVEERILESEAWKDNDPLYVSLEAEARRSENNVPSSPRKALSVVSQEAKAANAERSRLTKLEFFFRKLYRLAHVRLMDLCESLNIENDVRNKIWDLIVFLLSKEGELRLVYHRHVDQILLCSVYILCKLFGGNRDILFADIVDKYKSQPQFSEHTIMNVRQEEGQERVPIIKFYNDVFLPKVEAYLYTMNVTPSLPQIAALAAEAAASVTMKVPHSPMPTKKYHDNIFYNPRGEHLRHPPSPGPGIITASIPSSPIGTSPGNKLPSINRAVSSRKRLAFSEPSESPSPKRTASAIMMAEAGAAETEENLPANGAAIHQHDK